MQSAIFGMALALMILYELHTELLTISGIQKHEYLVYLWLGHLTELRISSWTMPHTFINCLLGQWDRVQNKWYQGSKSCLFLLELCAGQGTLVSISRSIIHGTKAAALVTKLFCNQDKGSISLLLAVRLISCNVQSLLLTTLWFFNRDLANY